MSPIILNNQKYAKEAPLEGTLGTRLIPRTNETRFFSKKKLRSETRDLTIAFREFENPNEK